MKLRTFHVFYYWCAVCALAVVSEGSEVTEWRDGYVSDSSESEDSREGTVFSNLNGTRDKRALGLILSGLAQAFGYAVSPVQVASLPNENEPDRGTQQSSNSNSMSSTQPTPTTPAPRQRETIRFTGVLNFGNSSGILTHLQQYENMFHGNNSNGAPGSTATPSTAAPVDPRNMNSMPVSPTLVNITLPTMRQPPLPEIPPENIPLAYPKPIVPVRNNQETIFRKNESSERFMVENKEIQNPKDVKSPPPPSTTRYTPFYRTYTDEPRWKKEHEQRLTELERKQEEHAERLRQQEQYRNRVKDHFDSQEFKKDHEEDDKCKGERTEHYDDDSREDEEEDPREKYETPERAPLRVPLRVPEIAKESQGNKEDEEYRDDDSPQTDDNYTNVKFDEPLPINDDDEQRKPEVLRNSYGEPLNSRDLIDDGFVRFFGKFKGSQPDFYDSESPDSKEDLKEEKDWAGNEDESNEKGREDLPASNKYEEYSLEEETDERKEETSNEDASDPFAKYPNKAAFNNENGSQFGEQKSSEEVDFSTYMPLLVPFRYLHAPEEPTKPKSRFAVAEKLEKIDNVGNRESIKRVSVKESRIGKKESLKPKIGLPERPMPKKLHEGEQKELQMWPPPFDFVLDSTIQTGVAAKPGTIKSTYISGKPEAGNKEEEKSLQQKAKRRFVAPIEKFRDYPDSIYYQRFKENSEPKRSDLKETITPAPRKVTDPDDTKSRLQQRKNVPDIWKHYKYNLNDNYKNVDPKTEVRGPIQQQNPRATKAGLENSNRFESFKRSIERIEPTVQNYYTAGYSEQANSDINNYGGPGFQLVLQKSIPATGFMGPRMIMSF